MPRTYSDDDRTEALALAEARGGPRAAATSMGMPVTTLEGMVERSLPLARAHVQTAAPAFADAWAAVVLRALAIISAQLERYEGRDLNPGDLQRVAVIAGVASDKHLDYRDGRKGAVTLDNSQHLTLPAGSTLDDVRALRDSLRAAQAVDASDAAAEALPEASGGGAAALTPQREGAGGLPVLLFG